MGLLLLFPVHGQEIDQNLQGSKREYPKGFNPNFAPPLKELIYEPLSTKNVMPLLKSTTFTVNGDIFFDNMESGENGWTSEGFMHLVVNPQNIQVLNPTINPNLVLLPDNGSLPIPYSGVSAWWYGEDETGTFIGKDFNKDQGTLTGGTSIAKNTGSLISPLIDLTQAANALLSFYSWWEIEGVDANAFDLLYVDISIDNGATFDILGKLNPVNDFNGEHYIPFTIGGLGQPAIWSKNVFNLNDYVGHKVIVRFRFETVDHLYNGFRGWLIDDVLISSEKMPEPEVTSVNPTGGNVGSNFEIYGHNFMGGAKVYIGDKLITSSVISENEINCIVPQIEYGTYNVSIINTDNEGDILLNGFTVTNDNPPAIVNITPNSKIVNESAEITIQCENLSGDAKITIGGKSLLNVEIVNNTITGVVPNDLTLGSHNVRVENPNGLYDLKVNSFHVLPQVEILAPNGGEIISSVGSYDIQYRLSKETTGIISLSTDNGFTWNAIHQFEKLKSGEHMFTWTDVPTLNSNYCLLKIQDNLNSNIFDISNATFTITIGENLPNKPSNLKVQSKTTSSVVITWTDNSVNETGFKVYRKTKTIWQELATTTSKEYEDLTIETGTTYYKVSAYSNEGESESTNIIGVTIGDQPEKPTNLSLSVKSDSEVKLIWNDNSNNEIGFKIERRTSSSSWNEIATIGANSESYTNKGLNSGATYNYRLRAYNSYGNSDYTDEESAETGSVPDKPLGVKAEATGTSSIKITWYDMSDNEDGFYIYQKPYNSSSYTNLEKVNKNNTSYEATGLVSGKTYTYKVIAYNDYGYTESSSVSAQTGSKPNAPTNVKASKYGDSKIKLVWGDNSSNETSFEIERSINNGYYYFDKTASQNSESYNTSTLSQNKTYKYRIRSVNAYGKSSWVESNSIEMSDGTFSATFTVNDKDGKVYDAEVYIKKKGSINFEAFDDSKLDWQSNKVMLSGLSVEDEILIRKEKEELAYESNKSAHEEVDDKAFVVYFDNGVMDTDGNYTYTKLISKKNSFNINLNHAVIGYNVIVSLEFGFDKIPYNEDYSSAFKNASKYLYNVTDGQAFFNKIYIYENSKNLKAADIKIENAYNDDAWPNATVFGLYKKDLWVKDYRIRMGRKWGGYNPGQPTYDRTIAHEFGHYGLGFYDEYISKNFFENNDIEDKEIVSDWDYRKENEYEFPTNYGFMDKQYSSTEMSSYNDYNKVYPSLIHFGHKITAQLGYKNMPCWQFFQTDIADKAEVLVRTPPYGYFVPGTTSSGYRVGGEDRVGPNLIPLPYICVVDFDNTSLSTKSLKLSTIASQKTISGGNTTFIKTGNTIQFIGKPGKEITIDIPSDGTAIIHQSNGYDYKVTDVTQPTLKSLAIATDTVVSPGILVRSKLKQTEPTFLFETLFQFDIELEEQPVIKYYFSGDTGSVILTTISNDKYLGTLQIDPSKEEYDGTGYFEINFTDTTGKAVSYIDKLTFEGLDNEELNLVYNYRLFTIIDNSLLDEIKLMCINNTFGNPINAYNQQLIPISDMYSFDIEDLDSISNGTGLKISYDEESIVGIDENSVGLYKWNESDNLWQKIDSNGVSLVNNSVTAAIYSEGSFALFATAYNTDTVAPSAITDLNVVSQGDGSYELSWTATGDDNNEGQALLYDIRWYDSPISIENWDSCLTLPTKYPKAAGLDEITTISISDTITTAYFAITVIDESNNTSLLSNVVSADNFILVENPAFAFTINKGFRVVDAVFIGKDISGTNNYDEEIDVVAEKPESGIHAYIYSNDKEELEIDYQSISGTSLQWILNIEYNGADSDTLTLNWDNTSIPKDGYYFINGHDLQDTTSLLFASDTSFTIIFKGFEEALNIPDLVKNEDFGEYQINLKPYFHKDDSLSFHAVIDQKVVNLLILNDSVLTLKSIPNVNGKSDILVYAIDTSSEVFKRKFNLQVIAEIDPFKVISQPQSTIACTGEFVTFEISTEGDDVLYNWYKEGSNIVLGDSYSLTLHSDSVGAGNYFAKLIFGCCDTLVTDTVKLMVKDIYVEPQSLEYGDQAKLKAVIYNGSSLLEQNPIADVYIEDELISSNVSLLQAGSDIAGTVDVNLDAIFTNNDVLGPHTVKALFTIDGNLETECNPNNEFKVSPENACASYTGDKNVMSYDANSFEVPVQLTAVVTQEDDGMLGDLRNAAVEFWDNETFIASAAVELTDTNDFSTGVATYNWMASVPQEYAIATKVAGYFTGTDCEGPTAVKTEYSDKHDVAGTGSILLDKACDPLLEAGGVKIEFNFYADFNVLENKISGDFIATLQRTEDFPGVRPIYQVSGNKFKSLSFNGNKAVFTVKSRVLDITNPIHPLTVGDSCLIEITMTDKSASGESDEISIAVWMDNGIPWFTSCWDYVNKIPKIQLLNTGNLYVKSASVGTGKGMGEVSHNVKVYPNPFSENLNFELSMNSNTFVKIEILDALGRTLETLLSQNVEANKLYQVSYTPKNQASQIILYKMTMGDKVVFGKAVSR